ncbi:Ger(x)C family spore germination protein [Paenibacillus sp. QZ-Y1]|uniref:Ger(x)C family spore germination protein n=1 Tax=Paenibacillus sp. QZ-Y1 TaxID=3414511 RepID=UPI003F796A37
MIRWKSILMLFVFGLATTGCGNWTELNDLGISTATGFDRQNGKWIITYQIIVPPVSSQNGSSSGGSQAPVNTFSSEGKTIREAIAKSSVENPKRLYFAHTNVVLIGEEAAKYGIAEILDHYYRNIGARESAKIIIAGGEAREYLKKLVPPEKQPGRALSDILARNNEKGSFYPVMNLHEVGLKITSDSASAGIPTLKVRGHNADRLNSIDIFKEISSPSKLSLEGLSVFYKDKQIGILNQHESMGISWLTNRVNSSNLTYLGEKGEANSFLVRKAKIKVAPVKKSHHYAVQVDARVDAELDESTSGEDIMSTHTIHELQRQAEQIIREQIMDGWKGNQRLHVDMLGIANTIHQRHPKDWKTLKDNWRTELAKMDINIKVDVTLKRVGLLQDSFSKLLRSKDEGKD